MGTDTCKFLSWITTKLVTCKRAICHWHRKVLEFLSDLKPQQILNPFFLFFGLNLGSFWVFFSFFSSEISPRPQVRVWLRQAFLRIWDSMKAAQKLENCTVDTQNLEFVTIYRMGNFLKYKYVQKTLRLANCQNWDDFAVFLPRKQPFGIHIFKKKTCHELFHAWLGFPAKYQGMTWPQSWAFMDAGHRVDYHRMVEAGGSWGLTQLLHVASGPFLKHVMSHNACVGGLNRISVWS